MQHAISTLSDLITAHHLAWFIQGPVGTCGHMVQIFEPLSGAISLSETNYIRWVGTGRNSNTWFSLPLQRLHLVDFRNRRSLIIPWLLGLQISLSIANRNFPFFPFEIFYHSLYYVSGSNTDSDDLRKIYVPLTVSTSHWQVQSPTFRSICDRWNKGTTDIAPWWPENRWTTDTFFSPSFVFH